MLPANYSSQWGVTAWEGSETTLILTATFQPGGVSDVSVNNQPTMTTIAGSAGQTLYSPATDLLGAE